MSPNAPMPFREKKAWFTIIALVVVFVPYYIYMVGVYHGPNPDFFDMAYMALYAIFAFVILEVALILLARWLSPEDAGIPEDEREKMFALKASRTAYAALISMILAVTIPMIIPVSVER